MKRYSGDYTHSGKDYQYKGDWYESRQSFPKLKKTALILMAELAVITLLFGIALLVNNSGSRVFWILMPCVTASFPIYYGWYGAWTLYSFCRKQINKNYTRTDGKGGKVIIPPEHRTHLLRSEYEQSVRRAYRSAFLLDGLMVITLASDAFYMITAKTEILFAREVVFFVTNLLILVVSVIFTTQTRKIRQDVIKKLYKK